jgi:ribosomal protein S18 acetylase RimI-like enzyme
MGHLAGVTLRQTRPQDAAACGVLLFATWPRLYRALLGDDHRAHEVLARLFAAPGNTFSFDATRVAERDGRILGIASSYAADQGQRRARASLVPAFRALGPFALARVLRAVWRIADASMGIDPRHWYVANVAVVEDGRGAGLGSLLLADAEAKARAQGLRGVSLELDGDEPEVRRFYERAGYEVVEERDSAPLRELTGGGRRLLMCKELDERRGSDPGIGWAARVS